MLHLKLYPQDTSNFKLLIEKNMANDWKVDTIPEEGAGNVTVNFCVCK